MVTTGNGRKIPRHELWKWDPFRTPLYRWKRAEELLLLLKRPTRFDDDTIKAAWKYLRRLRFGDDAAEAARQTSLGRAHTIYEEDDVVRHEIEARLLAGEPFDVIAGHVNRPVEVIELYEALFFCVADLVRNGSRSWVLENAFSFNHLVGIRRPLTQAEFWKWTAIVRGPAVLELVLSVELRRGPVDDVQAVLHVEMIRILANEWAAGIETDADVIPLLNVAHKVWKKYVVPRDRTSKLAVKKANLQMKFLRMVARGRRRTAGNWTRQYAKEMTRVFETLLGAEKKRYGTPQRHETQP